MDFKRDQLKTRISTLELMLTAEDVRPKPDKDQIAKLKKDIAEARSALEQYDKGHV